jgi:beta-glucosidase
MSHSTPNTEFSPPTSPPQNVKRLMQDTRLSARKKLAELNLEEKVGAYIEHLLCTG